MKAAYRVVPEFVTELLKKRGVVGEKALYQFLDPKLADLPAPGQMKNLNEAAWLCVKTVQEGRQLVVWGDYDVDGTTATSLLLNFFSRFAIEAKHHIPNRLTEGYGLHADWFASHREDFTSKNFLVIAVDCGISNHTEIEKIQRLGGEVIVLDHHKVPVGGPPPCLVVDPEQKDCGFCDHKLAGVGIAFYFVAAVRILLKEIPQYKERAEQVNLKQFLAFVVLGTIADLVPLTPVNRALARGGLEVLGEGDFLGLKEFLMVNNLFNSSVSSEDIGFLLGPKLNASGRLGDSATVVDLLTTADEAQAKKLASRLDQLNTSRKEICLQDTAYALRQLEGMDEGRLPASLILAGEYHLGVAGIVASRICEQFSRPVLVLGRSRGRDGKTILKGSARSVEGFDLADALEKASKFLISCGGHSMAAGLSLYEDNLKDFENFFVELVGEFTKTSKIGRRTDFDLDFSIDEAFKEANLFWLSKMEPFGVGNEAVRFRDKNARVLQAKRVGPGADHLSLVFRGKYQNHRGIAFGQGHLLDEVQESPGRSLVYRPTRNRFRGVLSWQVGVLSL